MDILVCPLSQAHRIVQHDRPVRIVSLLDPGHASPNFGADYEGRHLRLSFHDAHEPAEGTVLPTRGHMEQLLAFLTGISADESVLVHCRAGIGRSTAAAYVIACWGHPDADELTIARLLRSVAPLARPNETLVRHGDRVLERSGRMSNAIRDTGAGLPWIEVDEGKPFRIRCSLLG